LDKLDATQASEKGLAIRRAIDLMSALKLGVQTPMADIPADDFYAMIAIAEERDSFERERLRGTGDRRD
jgi:hypothetical protein